MKEHGGHKIDTNHHDFTSFVELVCMCVCVYRLPDVLSGGCLLSALIGEDLWRVLVRFQLLLRTHHEAAEETKEKKDSPTAKNDAS